MSSSTDDSESYSSTEDNVDTAALPLDLLLENPAEYVDCWKRTSCQEITGFAAFECEILPPDKRKNVTHRKA